MCDSNTRRVSGLRVFDDRIARMLDDAMSDRLTSDLVQALAELDLGELPGLWGLIA